MSLAHKHADAYRLGVHRMIRPQDIREETVMVQQDMHTQLLERIRLRLPFKQENHDDPFEHAHFHSEVYVLRPEELTELLHEAKAEGRREGKALAQEAYKRSIDQLAATMNGEDETHE